MSMPDVSFAPKSVSYPESQQQFAELAAILAAGILRLKTTPILPSCGISKA